MPGPHLGVSGDTLSDIATKYGLDLKVLLAWNDLADPDVIRPGQEINLEMPRFTW